MCTQIDNSKKGRKCINVLSSSVRVDVCAHTHTGNRFTMRLSLPWGEDWIEHVLYLPHPVTKGAKDNEKEFISLSFMPYIPKAASGVVKQDPLAGEAV